MSGRSSATSESRRKSVTFVLPPTNRNGGRLVPSNEESVLDTKPTRVLNFPLTVNQQLWSIFLLPSVIETTIYILDIAADWSIGIELLRKKYTWAGLATLSITYSAPLVCYVTFILDTQSNDPLVWLLVETAALIVYPLRAIQCFSERLFWAVEALRFKDPEREEALRSYEETRKFKIEHYLFLQGLIHAAPQAVFQLALLIAGYGVNPHLEKMMALSVITSVMSLSLVAMSFQRYETQAKGGRKRVWRKETGSNNETFDPANLEDSPQLERWIIVMDEDNPIGKIVAFVFWLTFLTGRIVALELAFWFHPWIVLVVCFSHWVINLLYILPSPDCKSSIPSKILLSFVLLFCLIEVGVQFRKSVVFYGLFFTLSCIENVAFSLLWIVWGRWSGFWFYCAIYLIIATQVLAFLLAWIYLQFFEPSVRRLN